MSKNPYLPFTLLSIFLLFFAACSDEQGNSSSLVPSVPEGYMAIEIIVPGVSTPATRALEAIDENDVETIDILAFNELDDKLVYHEEGTDIESTIANGQEKIFYVKIPQDDTDTYRKIYFMVIANAHDAVKAAKNDGRIAEGKTQKEVMRTLTFDVPTSGPGSDFAPKNAWPVKPGTFIRFPMWGISKVIDLNADPIIVESILLVRSVAKIDVGINFPENSDVPQGLGNVFKLEEIYVYNAHNKLMIAPTPDSYKALDDTPGVPDYRGPGSPFTKPSVLEGVGVVHPVYPLRDYGTTSSKLAYTNGIYVAEHAAGSLSDNNKASNFCLVIGARYGSDAAEGIDTTYYRVDFVKTMNDGEITPLPILRNHRYKVNITGVQGRGYDTPEEAFNAIGMNLNITVDLTDDDESLTEFEYDGQNMLGVSKGEFILDKNAHTNVEIKVKTTYTERWKATVTSPDSDWLTITTEDSTLKFSVAENNDGAERTGIITIQSGRLFKEITVVQRGENFIEIVGKKEFYIMDSSISYTLTVKSIYDWKVKVKKDGDPKNILRTFSTEGEPDIDDRSTFTFTMENDIIYQTILDANATLTFYSPTGEFVDREVTINGKSCFDLGGGVYAYPKDQPGGKSWDTYASDDSEPHSCAAIVPIKSWRLPTIEELEAIYATTNVATGDMDKYGFSDNSHYWSATTAPDASRAQMVNFFDGTLFAELKGGSGHQARCVRSK